MKSPLVYIFLILSLNLFSQSLVNGNCYYIWYENGEQSAVDSNYHLKFNDGFFQLHKRDSSLVFKEKFTGFFKQNYFDFFTAYNENQKFILNIKSKTIFEINPKLNPYYDFDYVKVHLSPYSNDTIIELKNNVYLNLRGEILFPGDAYTINKNIERSPNNPGKKIIKKGKVLKTEMDLFFEDEGYFNELSPEDYDEYIKENLVYREFKNKLISEKVFEDLEDSDLYFGNTLDERLYISKQNGKFGVISTFGKQIIQAEYDHISVLMNEDLMSIGEYAKFIAKKGKTTFVFSCNGKLNFQREKFKADEYYSPRYFQNSPLFNGYVLEKNGSYGLLATGGLEIIPPKYDQYDIFSLNSTQLYSEQKNINQHAECFIYPFENYYIGINNKSKMNDFYTPNGHFLNQIAFEEINYFNSRGYFTFELESKIGLAGPGACVLEKPEFNYIEVYMYGKDLFILETDSLSYFIDGKGNKLFNQNFLHATFTNAGFALATDLNSSKTGLLDFRNSTYETIWQIEPKYLEMSELEDVVQNKLFFKAKNNNKFGIIDDKENLIVDFKYDNIYIKDKNIITVKDLKFGMRDFQNNIFLENKYDTIYKFNNFKYIIKEKNNIAIYDTSEKKFLTDFDFETIKNIYLKKKDYYIIQKNGKYGVLDNNFDDFIECIYSDIQIDFSFSEFECIKADKSKDCIFAK